MKLEGVKVTANVGLRGKDLLLLKACANLHYDGPCKRYFHSGRGEEIWNLFCHQRGSPGACLEGAASIELSFLDLNRFLKLLEVGVPFGPEYHELAENIKWVMREIDKVRNFP